MRLSLHASAAVALGVAIASPARADPDTLLNVSSDIGRELFVAANAAFVAERKAATGVDVTINQSHASGSKQARAGNPKNIRNWDDLVRDDVKVVFPNAKTSSNARYTYLAAYAFALKTNNGDEAKADASVKKLLANVPAFDTGGRGSTTTFAERGIGDVLVTF